MLFLWTSELSQLAKDLESADRIKTMTPVINLNKKLFS